MRSRRRVSRRLTEQEKGDKRILITIESATSVKIFIDFDNKGLKPLVCPKHKGEHYSN